MAISYDIGDLKMNLITLGVFVARNVIQTFLCCRRIWKTETDFRKLRVLAQPDSLVTLYIDTQGTGNAKRSRILYETISDPFQRQAKAPWIWFGYQKLDGDMVELTSEMSEYVLSGNVIRHEMIHALFPDSKGYKILYVSPSEFEMVELSSEGLTIEDEIVSSEDENLSNSR
jgi:hypothetical protein